METGRECQFRRDPGRTQEPDGKIRLAHVVQRLGIAGMEYGIMKVANRLDPARFLPYIISLRPPMKNALPLLSDGVRLISLDEEREGEFGTSVRLSGILRHERIRIVHTHNWGTYALGAISAKIAGVPFLVHGEHGRETKDMATSWKRRHAYDLLSRGTSHFTTVSSTIREEMESFWGIPASRIRLIENGVDLSRFSGREVDRRRIRSEFGIGADSPVVGTVGGIRPVKDFPTLIRAFRMFVERHPDARLLIVGEEFVSGRISELETFAETQGIRDRVLFTGARLDIPELMAAMDVYVNSSLSEGMSNTILEAMSSRLPVIATRVGGNPDLVDGSTGILVNPSDSEGIRDGLLRLIGDPELARKLGGAGRERVERDFSFDRTVSNNEELYRELVAFGDNGRRSGWKKTVRLAISVAMHRTGTLAASLKVRNPSVTVLMYHRILPADRLLRSHGRRMLVARTLFEREMDYIRRSCSVLSLRDAVERLKGDGEIPPRAVVITFDDGYRDNYDFAFPILRQFGIPATIFLATGPVEQGGELWWDEVSRILLRGLDRGWIRDGKLPVDCHPAKYRTVLRGPLGGWEDRVGSVDEVIQEMNRSPQSVRDRILAELREAEKSAGEGALERSMLNWDEIREMGRSGIDFGAHTVNHAFLDSIEIDGIRSEVSASVEAIRKETGEAPFSFAYPRGAVNQAVQQILLENGIRVGLTTESGRNLPGCDLLALRRIDASTISPRDAFSESFLEMKLFGF